MKNTATRRRLAARRGLGRRPAAASTATCSAAARPSAPAARTAPTSASSPPGPPPRGSTRPPSTYRLLRGYAARLSDRGAAARTLSRKLASTRAFFRSMVEHGDMAANPADLLPVAEEAADAARARCKPADVAALLDRIPATTPLELRDRALFELAYACGLRAEELVDLDVGSIDFDGEQVRVEGKGVEDALRARRRARAGARSADIWSAAGHALAAADERPSAVPLQVRPAALDVRRPAPPAGLGAPRRDTGCGAPARPPALVRNPPAGGWRGPARHPGTAGSCVDLARPRSTLG